MPAVVAPLLVFRSHAERRFRVHTLLSPAGAFAATDGGAFNGNVSIAPLCTNFGHAMGIAQTDSSSNLTMLGKASHRGSTDAVGRQRRFVLVFGAMYFCHVRQF